MNCPNEGSLSLSKTATRFGCRGGTNLVSVLEIPSTAYLYQEWATRTWVLVVVHGFFVEDDCSDNGHSCHKKKIQVAHLLIFPDRFASLVVAVQDH